MVDGNRVPPKTRQSDVPDLKNFQELSMRMWSSSALLWFVALTLSFITLQSSSGFCQTIATPKLLFEQNLGQTDPQVRYLARSPQYQLYLTDTAAVFKMAGDKKDAVIRTTLQNANSNASIAGAEP